MIVIVVKQPATGVLSYPSRLTARRPLGKNPEPFSSKKMLQIRRATVEDCDAIVQLIKELAEFENMAERVTLTGEKLRRDGFSNEALYHCLVAELDEKLIGYVLFYDGYSTWDGPTFFVEDLYVKPSARGKGVGNLLWKELTRLALKEGCRRVQWICMRWNDIAIRFYEKRGAINLTAKEKWNYYQLDRDSMDSIKGLNDTKRDSIRPAIVGDCEAIFSLIMELAVFENMADQVAMTTEKLKLDGFSSKPKYFSLVVEVEKEIIAYALFFPSYSAWEGLTMFLEDLYVKESERRKGWGQTLFIEVVNRAVDMDCVRLEWTCLEWNRNAISLYKKFGGKNLTQTDERDFFRLNSKAIEIFAAG